MSDKESKTPIAVDEDDEEPIDKEQLEEYKEMVSQLGTFPDKVKINSLSMVAEDHAESYKNALQIYACIKEPLVDPAVSTNRKLPLVYVIDSIAKNVKGHFVTILQQDAKNWMPIVYSVLPPELQAKLEKVWNLWRSMFDEATWKEMGSCFLTNAGVAKLAASQAVVPISGIPRAPDGTLQLTTALRKQMQLLLDDAQSDVTNELEKVSLERLADINPDLLKTLKQSAEELMGSNGGGPSSAGTAGQSLQQHSNLSFIIETRPPTVVEQSKEWQMLAFDANQQVPKLVSNLQQSVQSTQSSEATYSQLEAIQMTNTLAAASVVATHLTEALENFVEQRQKTIDSAANNGSSNNKTRRYTAIDKSLFTNDGVKKRDVTIIGSLYELGLPFISSSDGRRFANQLDLSKHLDYLFKKNQLEKSMERTEERGWYVVDEAWTGEADVEMATTTETEATGKQPLQADNNVDADDPSKCTVPADETRDKCVICGINFKMVFDADEGQYKYNNCREMECLNDDAAEKESESVLVHVTCWRGLGSPEVLTADQTLQDMLHY